MATAAVGRMKAQLEDERRGLRTLARMSGRESEVDALLQAGNLVSPSTARAQTKTHSHIERERERERETL